MDVTVDPITLEVLRTRLEAISDESAMTIERTAISPVVTESKDYSATLLDGEGDLISGGGRIEYHFGAAQNAVRSTIARHGATIAAGDVFLANDPHNGGGLHAQDVMVQQPVFVDGEMVAWVVNSAHLMDMGGMVMGSWAPAATECFQEAIRFPPVRLFRAGVEEVDVWAIFRNNVRISALVEMDLRALVAGCHVAEDKLIEVIGGMGVAPFGRAVAALLRHGRARAAAAHRGHRRRHLSDRHVDRVGRRPLRRALRHDRGGRPPDLRFRRRRAPGDALLQLEAVHHRSRAGG